MGKLEVISGCMFSGKTDALIREVRRCLIAGKEIKLFKPRLDGRYEGEHRICTHDGICIDATPVTYSWVIPARTPSKCDVVFIEEAQFFDGGLPRVVANLVQRNKRVVVTGTDRDFRGITFGSMGELMAQADEVLKLKAICVKCGEEAVMNQRLVNGEPANINDPVVQVGGAESYEARCRSCFELRR